LVHFGVASKEKKIKLETRAWNGIQFGQSSIQLQSDLDATFRVCDERGWKPELQPIIPECGGIESFSLSSFDVELIQKNLLEKGFEVDVSTDPGRFVCNWL
jgi:hypothetical protein